MNKFRAYDKVRREYLSSGQVFIAIQPGQRPKNSIIYLDIIQVPDFYKDRFIIEQFTGLNDKHGVEIYEGDIYKKHNYTYMVIWTQYGFMQQTIYDGWLKKNILNREEKTWISEVDCKNFIEIIGNIHDNPWLLEM